MSYLLQLKQSDAVLLPRAQVRALLRAGDGAAALLYLYLAEAGQSAEDTDICRALHWDRATLEGAEETLRRLGTLGEKQEAPAAAAQPPARERTAYSRSDIAAVLEKDGNFAALRKAVGQKLNKIMTEKDDDMLLGLYDDLGLPADVIFLLVGHCIERAERRYGPERRPTMRQIEKEGYRWKRLGLLSAELAEEYLKDYARKQQRMPQLMEALHLGGRDPVSRERTYLERWIDWGFPPEAVEYAYEKTVFKCGKLEWGYLNGILSDLHKKGLHTLEEITAGDKLPAREDRRARPAGESSGAGSVQDSVAWMREYLKKTGGREKGE